MPPKPLPTRIVGLDYGVARIGIALSDERRVIAMPLQTLKTERRLEETIDQLINVLKQASEGHFILSTVVIGLPLRMSGQRGVMADEVVHFAEQLQSRSGWTTVLWDERLTSVQAERSMMEGNLSRKKRSQLIDTVAAVIILQNYLDAQTLSR